MADEDPILDRLDRILAVLQLAHFDAIQKASTSIRKDPVFAAILESCADDWVSANEVRNRVQIETKVSAGTVKTRIAQLIARRALFERGSTSNRAYRSSNLI
jgi:hypothetical protein